MIEVKNLHKSYRNGAKVIPVLKGVNLGIARGEFVAIAGPSGAGKSTLLHLLGGLDYPGKGSVLFEGTDIYAMSESELCKLRNERVGFVFQFYHLLAEFTVFENVLLPSLIRRKAPEASVTLKKRAEALLIEVGLKERMSHFPAQLSGGEKQRVAIVRGLMNEPQLLLCDEPTGNLDSQAGDGIINLIKRLNTHNQMTVILVTHNLELAKVADRVYHLRDGVLVK